MGKKPTKRSKVAENVSFAYNCANCEIHECEVGPNNSSSGKISLPSDWVGETVLLVRPIPPRRG